MAGASQGFGGGTTTRCCLLHSTEIGRGEGEKWGEKGDWFERFDACQIGGDWIVVEEGKKRVVVGGLRLVEENGRREGENEDIAGMENTRRKGEQLVCAFETMLMLDYDQQIPHIDQSLFGVGCDVRLGNAERKSGADLPWGPHFCADVDVGSRRQEELPDPGIESVTAPLKKRAAGRIAW